jgi:hypothetical protein
MSQIMYQNLRANMSFSNQCALWELRYLNSGNIINLEQVRVPDIPGKWSSTVVDILWVMKYRLHNITIKNTVCWTV